MMTDEDLQSIRERCEKATAGPWTKGSLFTHTVPLARFRNWPEDVPHPTLGVCAFCDAGYPAIAKSFREEDRTPLEAHIHVLPDAEDRTLMSTAALKTVLDAHGDYDGNATIECSDDDFTFLMKAREDVPSLLAEVDRLRAELAATRDLMSAQTELAYHAGCEEEVRDEREACALIAETAVPPLFDDQVVAHRTAEHITAAIRARTPSAE